MLGAFGLARQWEDLPPALRNLTAIGSRLVAGLCLASIFAIVVMVFARRPRWPLVPFCSLAWRSHSYSQPLSVSPRAEPRLYGSIFGIIRSGFAGPHDVPKLIGHFSVGLGVQRSLCLAGFMGILLFGLSLFLGRKRKTSS